MLPPPGVLGALIMTIFPSQPGAAALVMQAPDPAIYPECSEIDCRRLVPLPVPRDGAAM